MPKVDFAQIRPVDLEEPGVVAVDALEQPCQGRLPRAAAPYDAEQGPAWNCETYSLECRNLGSGVGEGDIVEADCAGKFRTQAARRGIELRRLVDDRRRLADSSAELLIVL